MISSTVRCRSAATSLLSTNTSPAPSLKLTSMGPPESGTRARVDPRLRDAAVVGRRQRCAVEQAVDRRGAFRRKRQRQLQRIGRCVAPVGEIRGERPAVEEQAVAHGAGNIAIVLRELQVRGGGIEDAHVVAHQRRKGREGAQRRARDAPTSARREASRQCQAFRARCRSLAGLLDPRRSRRRAPRVRSARPDPRG